MKARFHLIRKGYKIRPENANDLKILL